MPATSELRVGMKASITRTVTEADVEVFARATGDTNPVHLDEEVAQRSRFGERVAHGMLTAGHISAVLGTKLPGPGAIYLEQTLRFVRPVRFGDAITSTVEVIEIADDKPHVRLRTTSANQEGKTVLLGEALILMSEGDP